jgi:lipoprotein-anchoring transpeptidase ErfK/SrfK
VLAAGVSGCSLFNSAAKAPPVAAAPSETFPHYLVLRLGERRVYLMNDTHKPVESFKVAIGRKPWETPVGRFAVKEMVENPDFVRIDWNDPSKVLGRMPPGPNSPLGLRWIGFASAYGWDIGFHGTAKTQLLGQAVSHGCVRMSNPDVVKLYQYVKVGTPVIVEP